MGGNLNWVHNVPRVLGYKWRSDIRRLVLRSLEYVCIQWTRRWSRWGSCPILPPRSIRVGRVTCHMYGCKRVGHHGPILVNVHGSLMVTFCTIALYGWDQNGMHLIAFEPRFPLWHVHTNNMRWLVNPNRGRSHFPHTFGARTNVLFIMKMKISVLIDWSYRYLQLSWLSSLQWLTCFCLSLSLFLSQSNAHKTKGIFKCLWRDCAFDQHYLSYVTCILNDYFSNLKSTYLVLL